ncbi:MAG: fibronectin type III domain-containing protein, partial [Cyclobacteriaceae bacterium]
PAPPPPHRPAAPPPPPVATAFCQGDADPSPVFTTGSAGTFSSIPAGLDINTATGEIDPQTSTPGNYRVTNTIAGSCADTDFIDIVINADEDASFSYASATFCQGDADPLPNSIATGGGTFSSTVGLALNGTTGEIDLDASTAGPYTITYTTAGACPASSTFDITINATPTANDQTLDVCEDALGSGSANVDLPALENAINGGVVTIDWFEDIGLTVPIGTPATFTVTGVQTVYARVTEAGCTNVAEVEYTVNGLPVVADQTPVVCEDTEGIGNATVSLTALQPAIDGAAGYTFTWYTDAARTSPVGDPGATLVSNGDDFYAEVSDGTCVSIARVDYTVNSLTAVSFAGLASPYCNTDGVVAINSNQTGGTFVGPGITDNGDGTASFDPGAAGDGTHTITFSFTDGNGCTNQTSQQVVVNDCTAGPVADFIADATTVCEGNTVTFTDGSFGATTYNWDFGFGATPATATGVGPHVVTYNTNGLATVSLTIDQGLPTEHIETKTDFISIGAPDDASFSYAAISYCPTDADPSPDAVATPGGTFSAPAGLVINAATGEIDVDASTDGTYTITYTTAGTCPASSTFDVTIQPTEDASFDYGGATACCQSDGDPVAVIGGTPGGTFTATAGLVIDAATGQIDLSASTAAAHTVTYTTGGACSVSEDLAITITAAEDASFGYSSATFCADAANPTPTVATVGGTFSAPAGLVINGTTGEIDIAASTVGGPYTITYSFGGACPSSATFDVTITNSADASFDYGGVTAFCQGDADPSPVFTTGSAGTFSSIPAGLALNTATGEIDPLTSTPGNYRVTNTIAGSCADTDFIDIVINADEDASFSYASATFCQTDAVDPVATITGTAGGTFTSSDPANLIVVANGPNAGTIDLDASQPGTYDITYMTPGTCAASSIVSVTLTAPAASVLSYSAASFCQGSSIMTSPTSPVNGTFAADNADLIVDANTGVIDVDASVAGDYTITYTPNDACTDPATFDVTIQAAPTANAGLDGGSCTFDYQLSGNTPATGLGTWGIVTQPVGSNFSFDDANSPTAIVTVDMAGSYEFRWEVVNGCGTATDDVSVDFAEPLVVTKNDGASDEAICGSPFPFGAYAVTVTGGSGSYTYAWSGSDWNGNTISETDNILDNDFLGVPGGIYTLTITDAVSFCDTTIVAVVGNDGGLNTEGATPDVEVTTSTVCGGASDGDIEVSVPASTDSYVVRYYDSTGTQLPSGSMTIDASLGEVASYTAASGTTGLAAGTYYIEVEDVASNGLCRVGDTVTIAELASPIVISVDDIVDLSCVGASDGSIDISVTGGTGAYTFQWLRGGFPLAGETNEDIIGLDANTQYQIVVTDAVNTTCIETSAFITISDPPLAAGPNALDPVLTTITCSSFTARWDEVSGATYQVDVAEDNLFTTMVVGYNAAPVAAGTLELPVNGLTVGGTYFYRVRAIDGGCITDNSNVVSVTTSDAPTTTALAATNVACDAFTVNWNEVPGADYRVDVATDNTFATVVVNDVAVAAGTFELIVNTGITSGTTYFYRVRAVDPVCGTSLDSNTESVTTLGTPIARPTNVVVDNATCTGFDISWDAVADVTFYRVEADDPLVAGVEESQLVPDGTLNYTFSSLTSGVSYNYSITPIGACSDGPAATGTFDTRSVPAAPTGVIASNPVCDGFTLSWDAVTDAEEYVIEVSNDGFVTTTIQTVLDPIVSIDITGLLQGESYDYRITARNACGIGFPSATGTTATNDIPAAPTNLIAQSPTCDGFQLDWDAVTGATSYIVEVSNDGFVTIVTENVNTNTVVLTGLTQATSYEYRVTSQNSCGLSTTTVGAAPFSTDDIPVAPANVTASNESCDGFDVSWDAVANATSYRVEVSSDGFGADISTLVVTGTDTTFTTLSEETTYSYRVTAINACGDGGTLTSATTMATSPSALCGCGFDRASFNVVPVDASCIGANDGQIQVFTATSSVVPPSRFRYRYRSLDDVTLASDWDSTSVTLTGIGIVVFDPDTLPAGNYEVIIEDMNADANCITADTLDVQIGVQNDIAVSVQAETCSALGEISLSVPEGCLDGVFYEFRVYLRNDEGVDENANVTIDPATGTISDAASGTYTIHMLETLTQDTISTVNAFVPNNCSGGGGGTSITCELGDKTIDVDVTSASCETGEGGVTFTVVGGETNSYIFRIVSLSGAIDETETAVGSASFSNLPSGEYDYIVIDESGSPRCQSRFTVTESIVVIGSTDFTLPGCEAPEQVATLDLTISPVTNAPAPYDVYAILGADTVSSTFIDTGLTTATLTGLPTGEDYQVVVQSRASNTCAGTQIVTIPETGEIDISFDHTLTNIECFGEGAAVTVSNIVVAENESFSISLFRTDQTDPYATRLFSIIPSSFTFTDLEIGEYQIVVEQSQSTCGITSIERSEAFSVEGPIAPLTAEVEEIVRVSVNDPYGDITIGNITGGGPEYEVRIAVDPEGNTQDWIEVVNDNPAIDPYEHVFTGQERGFYLIEVRDRFGCTVQYTVEVRYTEELYIPNIFTPNGDGENDTFRVVNLDSYSDEDGAKMIITSRWGTIVYQSDNYTNAEAWDGEQYPDGIYFYRLILPTGEKHNGWVEIWRGRTP